MNPKHVVSKQHVQHYTWGKICTAWPLVETAAYTIKQEFMPPHTREELHLHQEAQQFFFILNGEAVFYLGEETIYLREQQGLLVPPGTPHYIANEAGKPLEFLVFSTPPTAKDRVHL
ncbi:MAG: cupin domain-containing protein [Dinghuibacter sp.]|nr:cupin domain-containing protein [Dinghuibacter sp.]